MGINEDLKAAIQEAIQTDKLSGPKLRDILASGPRQVTKGLQEWNYKDGLILYKGLIYVPNNEELKCKVTQQFHGNARDPFPKAIAVVRLYLTDLSALRFGVE